ncbi:MAG: mitofilin family membrane protein [Hyphomicrobiales bacterium]
MAGSFDKKGSGPEQASKRPAPTIEGTATEVVVEPDVDETAPKKEAAAETKPDDGDSDKPEVKDAPQTKPEPKKRRAPSAFRSFLTHLTAGIIGGLAAAAVLVFAWGRLPSSELPPAVDLSPLENRLSKLEAAPEAPDNSEAVAKLEGRVDALENAKPEAQPELAALTDRVDQLETNLKAISEAAKDGGSVADAAAISQQIGEAEARLDAKVDSALADQKAANAASLDKMQKEVAELSAKLKALTEAELGGGADSGPDIAALDERLNRLESTIPELLEAVDDSSENTKAATMAIAFANLRAAVNEGRPYVSELSTLAALSPGAGDLGPLLDYDDTGIPTVPELTRSFKAAKDAALAAPAPSADGSLFDQLFASAESLVKVRRVDAEAEGDGADAVLARAEAQLDDGNLAEAVKEVETLEGSQRAAFADWLDQAHARLDANAALQKLEGILLVSLGGNKAHGAVQTDEQD